jgi:hypothetical protein
VLLCPLSSLPHFFVGSVVSFRCVCVAFALRSRRVNVTFALVSRFVRISFAFAFPFVC